MRGSVTIPPVRRYCLRNGLRVIYIQKEGMRTASAFMFLKVGSRYESARRAGLAHFCEHSVFKGTESYPGPCYIARATDSIAADLNASTHAEYTEFYGSCSRRHFSEMLELLKELVVKPVFPPEEIEKEKSIVIDEIRQSYDSTGNVVNLDELVLRLLWGEGYFYFIPTGKMEIILGFGAEELARFHRKYFVPENAVLCCVGDLDDGEVLEAVERSFGSWRGRADVKPRRVRLCRDGPGHCFRRFHAALTAVKLAFPTCSYSDPCKILVSLLSELIGGGATSRLFLRLREEHGLVYDVGSSTSYFTDVGWMDVFFSSEPEDVPRALKLVNDEISSLLNDGLGTEELKALKERLVTTLEMIIDRTDDLAEWYGVRELLRKPRRLHSPMDEIKKVDSVTSRRLKQCARRFLKRSLMKVVLVGPLRKPELRRALTALGMDGS